jgi:hypothetical protein
MRPMARVDTLVAPWGLPEASSVPCCPSLHRSLRLGIKTSIRGPDRDLTKQRACCLPSAEDWRVNRFCNCLWSSLLIHERFLIALRHERGTWSSLSMYDHCSSPYELHYMITMISMLFVWWILWYEMIHVTNLSLCWYFIVCHIMEACLWYLCIGLLLYVTKVSG